MRDDSGLAAPLLRIVSDRTPDEFGPSAVEEHIVPLVRVTPNRRGARQACSEHVAYVNRTSICSLSDVYLQPFGVRMQWAPVASCIITALSSGMCCQAAALPAAGAGHRK